MSPASALTLDQWLDRIEAIHPTEIDLGLDRVRVVRDRLGMALSGCTITVAGTNGKGSVCALLESIARSAGYRVGTFTSPHLVHFNERGRIDGESVADETLIAAFEAVERARAEVSLTYFEFTALAILKIFSDAHLDLNILEVGLGGRLDAVNAFDSDCAILTCVAIDHAAYLGDTREAIGLEKAHVFRPNCPAICADPVPPATVAAYANQIGADLWQFGVDFNYAGDRQQWSYAGRSVRRNALAYPALRGANQLLNASAVLAAFEALRNKLPIAQKDVRQGFAQVSLRGRFDILPGQPAVILDAAHNPHAVSHLAANLDNMGFFPYTYGVFGVMADKDIDAMLDAIGGRIDHWYVTSLPGSRAARASDLEARLQARGLSDGGERTVTVCESPAAGLLLARERAGENDRIVVFGSFLTVADILAANAEPKLS